MLYVQIDSIKTDDNNYLKEKIKQSNGNFKLIKQSKQITCSNKSIILYKIVEDGELKYNLITANKK